MLSDHARTDNLNTKSWRYSILCWLVSAVILLMVSAGLLAKGIIPYDAIGYLSSVISFLTAMFAGLGLSRGGRPRALAMISGAFCLVILLLTAGYIISRGQLSSSGIMSAASFTLAGFLSGAFLPGNRKRGKRRTSRINRRKRR